MLADFKPIPAISIIKGSNKSNIDIIILNIAIISFLDA